MDYGNTKTPSMHSRLGSVTVAAGFPQGKQPKFPMGEIPLGQYSSKKKISVFGNSMVKDLVVTLLFLGGVSLGSCQCADPWQPVQPFQPAA